MEIRPVKEWSAAIMINHWVMAIAVLVLIVTGFYIASPFTIYSGETVNKFFMGNMRYVHILFGIILMFIFIWRLYLAFFSKFHADWKDFFSWLDFDCTWKQIKFYLLIEKESPSHEDCIYGPMQALAYSGLFFFIFAIVITGLILMGAGYHAGFTAFFYKILKPVENMLGGLAIVRYVHHILTWLFILFIVVHVYMAFWYDAVLKEGTVSSMISGVLFERGKK
ncbi:MAG TPA: Ni/Fe-hydrogenase, b-type cytochrome subunit [Syntrophales bacterium]|nr:Ni/Fe-hydrogenase, b-type cytochrome subunit [Syntrophales bacterium]